MYTKYKKVNYDENNQKLHFKFLPAKYITVFSMYRARENVL